MSTTTEITDHEAMSSEHYQRAAWYAWGRMDSGHPAVRTDAAGHPDEANTAHYFGLAYARAHVRFKRELTYWAPSMHSAWDTFVATGARSVRED